MAAFRHGAYVKAQALSTNPRVIELADSVRETQPIEHAADEGGIQRLALTYYRIEAAARALDEADAAAQGHDAALYRDEKHSGWLGRLRADLASWMRLAGQIEAELGRTPASRGKLGVHVSQARRNLSLIERFEEPAA